MQNINDLRLYNLETLQELYAVAWWKVYGRFPSVNIQGYPISKETLINQINALSYRLESKGD